MIRAWELSMMVGSWEGTSSKKLFLCMKYEIDQNGVGGMGLAR